MGLIWDLIQHGQITRTQEHAQSIELRLQRVEDELERTNDALMKLLRALESRFGEDLDRDGVVDTWTYFGAAGDKEVVSRVEKDTAKRGKPDVFESYAQQGDKTVLTKREEDKNGDGKPDVISIYENGKLKERQITDPDLVPL